MSTFTCKECGEDLSIQLDAFVHSIRLECTDGQYPSDLFLKGRCHGCDEEFEFSGPMFTSFAVAKAQEGIVSNDINKYTFIDLAVTAEEYKEFMELNVKGKEEELEEFLRELALRGRLKKR